MEEKIEKITQERDEYLAGWKRAKADFINYKKEEAQRMQVMAGYAYQQLLLMVLPILDNVDRAVKQIPEEEKDNQIYKGFLQIASQWREFLKSQGIEEVETVGKPFDPEMHEAVGEVGGEEPGMVAEEVEKGYIINGKLLRPAKVKITK
ncbi:MAG TPA: nucleotide exchange factor GrpE [Candidatus Paceibacterota bacterium]|nr:nucleotide exchange factor GrpE [Candidatus Paceibacterota bacterium]